MPESTQHKLDRIRPPRVQITYDLEVAGAVEKKELPLVVGVMSDLAGNAHAPLPRVKSRKFVSIDRDNFEEVMGSVASRIKLSVPNRISKDAPNTTLNLELEFKKMDDFSPLNIISQVEPLKKLFEARGRLNDLLVKLDGNDGLDTLLQDIIANTEGLKEIKASAAPASNGEKTPSSDESTENPAGN
jgi:type VI secretion system protein ImpB